MREHHLLALERPARRRSWSRSLRRLLVLLALGGLRISPSSRWSTGRALPGQEVGQRVDVRPVRLLGDPRRVGDARARAPADVEVEAGPSGARPLVEERVRARSDREDPREGVERVADGPRVAVRAEVPDLLPLRAAQHLRPRPPLPHGQRQVGIGLVVAVADVEPRPVRPGSGCTRASARRPRSRRRSTRRSRPRSPSPRSAGAAGGPSRIARRLRSDRAFPDVDDATVGVTEQVRAGRVGDRRGGPAEGRSRRSF